MSWGWDGDSVEPRDQEQANWGWEGRRVPAGTTSKITVSGRAGAEMPCCTLQNQIARNIQDSPGPELKSLASAQHLVTSS